MGARKEMSRSHPLPILYLIFCGPPAVSRVIDVNAGGFLRERVHSLSFFCIFAD
jgi:hypothetical protein